MSVDLRHVPGALPALKAVQYVGGVLLPAESAVQLVVAALYVADPYIRADALADMADDAAEAADYTEAHGDPHGASVLRVHGRALDWASHRIREELASR